MQSDGKYSRFMFHLKFSRVDDFVNEHELYEVMRSRNLYQVQFGVRSNYQKIMRNIIKEERQRKYNFDNTRKMFVQKMKERREQVDKLRSRTTQTLNSLSDLNNERKKPVRRYVPLQSTVVYTELPKITQSPPYHAAPPLSRMLSPPPPPPTSAKTPLLPVAPSPSMVASPFTDDPASVRDNKINVKGKRKPTERIMASKVIIAGKRSPLTVTATALRSKRPTEETCKDADTVAQLVKNSELVDELRNLKLDNDDEKGFTDKNNTLPSQMLEQDAALDSTVCLENNVKHVQENFHTCAEEDELQSESKVKMWAEKHSIRESKANLIKEYDFQRMLIDRPSKWAFNHTQQDSEHFQTLEVRQSKEMLKKDSRLKSKALDALPQKLNLRHRISLPALDTTPRPMVTLDPGGTTPDGRLILTNTDYEAYLSNYRKARALRLERSIKRNRRLEKKIEKFRIDPQQCLHDDTCLRASLRTI